MSYHPQSIPEELPKSSDLADISHREADTLGRLQVLRGLLEGLQDRLFGSPPPTPGPTVAKGATSLTAGVIHKIRNTQLDVFEEVDRLFAVANTLDRIA
jgi:hypothetical protein